MVRSAPRESASRRSPRASPPSRKRSVTPSASISTRSRSSRRGSAPRSRRRCKRSTTDQSRGQSGAVASAASISRSGGARVDDARKVGKDPSLDDNRTEQPPSGESSDRPGETDAELLADGARLEGVLLTVRDLVHQVANALTEAQGYAELALMDDDLPANTRELLNRSM